MTFQTRQTLNVMDRTFRNMERDRALQGSSPSQTDEIDGLACEPLSHEKDIETFFHQLPATALGFGSKSILQNCTLDTKVTIGVEERTAAVAATTKMFIAIASYLEHRDAIPTVVLRSAVRNPKAV